LSSILEALKKAEQEATMGRGAGTPWPAPLPTQTTYRQRPRRWWIPLSIGVALCVAAVVFWQVRQPDRTRPADPTPPPAPLPLPKPNQPVQPPVSEAPKPSMPVTEPQRVPPAKAIVDAPPRQSAQQMRASDGQRIDPKTEAAPVPPERQPIRDATASSEAMPVPAEDSSRRPTGPATAAGPSEAASTGTEKFFKSDPRIDLQALVWSPESTARFVVINNRLIKEGGSIDDIVVVRINRDDVLLAEGSDRWHEVFKIR
jgi:hypothetical protein